MEGAYDIASSANSTEHRVQLEARKKQIFNQRARHILKSAFCFALTFNADDSLLAVGIMQGFSQSCSVSFYRTDTWELVKRLPRINAVEFFPAGRCNLGGLCGPAGSATGPDLSVEAQIYVQRKGGGTAICEIQKTAKVSSIDSSVWSSSGTSSKFGEFAKRAGSFIAGGGTSQDEQTWDTTSWICVQDLMTKRNDVICTDTWRTLCSWKSVALDTTRLKQKVFAIWHVCSGILMLLQFGVLDFCFPTSANIGRSEFVLTYLYSLYDLQQTTSTNYRIMNPAKKILQVAPIVVSPDAKFVVTTRTVFSLETQQRVLSLESEDESGAQRRFLFMDFTAHIGGKVSEARRLTFLDKTEEDDDEHQHHLAPTNPAAEGTNINSFEESRRSTSTDDGGGSRSSSIAGSSSSDRRGPSPYSNIFGAICSSATRTGRRTTRRQNKYTGEIRDKSVAEDGLFAAVIQVQGENKIYLYETAKWALGTDPSARQPCSRLYEPNVSYSKVRFINDDRWLASFGEEAGHQNSGVRIWDTSTWALVHLIDDGISSIFPFCCGWRNPWIFCIPNRRKLAEEREALGQKFGDVLVPNYQGHIARVLFL